MSLGDSLPKSFCSTIEQRAWLLKLIALELHLGDVATTTHRGTCIAILSHLFAQCNIGISGDSNVSHFFEYDAGHIGARTMNKCKVFLSSFQDYVLNNDIFYF